jgi:hypothetical protein
MALVGQALFWALAAAIVASVLFWEKQPRVVKIFKCVDGSRSSMMDVEDEHNHMRPAFGIRYRIGKPGTPAAE